MLGRAILKQLRKRNDIAVTALYRSLPAHPPDDHVSGHLVNFESSSEVTNLLRAVQPTVLIHAAATGMQVPRPDAAALHRANVELPGRLASAAAEIGNCHFVHLSSGLAYTDKGRALNEDDELGTSHPYGASKVAAEEYLRTMASEHSLPLTILRPFSFTGEGDVGSRLFPSLLASAAANKPFEMSDGAQVRDHTSVNDIARGVVAAALLDPPRAQPRVFNLGSGDTRTLRDLVVSVITDLDLKLNITFGVRPHTPGEPMFLVADTTRARETLSWQSRESVAHAVWQLAQSSLPSLTLKEPACPDE